MSRSSKAVVEQQRGEILDAAAQQVKQRGVEGITIPEAMKGAGLSPGGFYTYFESKEDLTERAVQRAFEVHRGLLRELSAEWEGDHLGAADTLAGMYLARTDPTQIGVGCPITALSADVARTPVDSPLREVYVTQLRQNVAIMASLGEDEGPVADAQRARALARLATVVGASVLARASAGDPLADEVLAAVRGVLERDDDSELDHL